ncbi:uncharacterized protein J4E88_001847 [Alternaria novae-zelandiae]|uniref:uncharacterized protein n=1 Tax=Alternaria novae-zelandiae TaxID=430562 RepID=UPI0020C31FD7|nr:uncharacterized protein J4E88_001847 [Alternaria novae-zelandiae]KAI4693475.1 hypothetical protein J4E88_001847 [Alternaria novae-zelandiae]
MYLHTPNGCPKQNITQRAFIRVNQAKKPVSTVTLIGQHGQEEFDLRDPSQLYKLFDAVVDSEFIFALKEQLRLQDALQQTVEPPPQSTAHAHPGLPSIWNNQVQPPAHALVGKNSQVRPHARVLAIKNGPKEVSKKPSRRRLMEQTSFKTHPCRMRYQLLSYSAIPFHLITWPRSESVVPPSDLAESSALPDFITVDGEAGCEYDEMLLFYLMGLAMERLTLEGFAELAHEVCDLRIRLSRSRRGVDPPFGPTSGRLLAVEPHGLDDKIHVICRGDVEKDKIRMWVVNEDQGQQSCIIRIEKRSENASRTLSSLGKREVSSSPRVYCDIASKKVKVE